MSFAFLGLFDNLLIEKIAITLETRFLKPKSGAREVSLNLE